MSTTQLSNDVAELLMEQVMKILALAAGDDAQRGGRFLFTLAGDLGGEFVMDLTPGQVTVVRSDGRDVDGRVSWQVSFGDVASILEDTFEFAAARREQRLVIDADTTNRVKLERALDLMTEVDLAACLRDPAKVLAERFYDTAIGEQPDGNKPNKSNVGVRIRK